MDRTLIGKNVQLFRERKGISQEILAEQAGLSTAFIASIEQGVKTPSLDSFIKIANILSVSADDLLGYQIRTHYEIKGSKLGELIQGLPSLEQKKIYDVVEVMVKNADLNR